MARDGAIRPVKGTVGCGWPGHALDKDDDDGAGEYENHRLGHLTNDKAVR